MSGRSVSAAWGAWGSARGAGNAHSSQAMVPVALVLALAAVSELLARHVSANADPDFSPYYKSIVSNNHQFHFTSSFCNDV